MTVTVPTVVARTCARGIAFFFGVFSLANALVAIRTGRAEDLWWIDLGGLPSWLSVALWRAAGLLVAYAVVPAMSTWRRNATAIVSVLLALAGLWNSAAYYLAWRGGTFTPAVPVPFTAIVAVGFFFVGHIAFRGPQAERTSRIETAGVAALVVLLAVAFPLAHVYFFGTTDYRRDADVAVVFGAKAYASGALSQSLEDRVRTAAGLYNDGLVDRLVMSGGIGESGADEAEAMAARARELGVPASAITLDHKGDNTDLTVANTTALFAADGTRRVLVVSQFYHLPRIKMAYRAAGWNVYTVPATENYPIVKTPVLVAREIPGFWVYWARAWARDLFGTQAAYAAAAASGVTVAPAALSPAMEHARDISSANLIALEASTPAGVYPFYTLPDGSWEYSIPRRWVAGFLPGMLWHQYERTHDPAWRDLARVRQAPVVRYATDTGTHDLGFMLQCSLGNDYRLTGSASARDTLLTAARSLATRYDPVVGMVRTLKTPADFYVYNDTMVNIELLYWGARNGGDPAWKAMATSHARRAMSDFTRADGSTYHYVAYDEATGAVVDKGQGQGFADESTWSRGQAWTAYGLAVAYRETDDSRFLAGAHAITDYWVANAPADLVPYWDFDAPSIPHEPRDSSAAAAAAVAFQQLAMLDPDPARRAAYAALATDTLESLSSPAYLDADESTGTATLLHGTYFAARGLADHGTSWGDYYFASALAREGARVTRIAGPDRYITAVRASRATFTSATTVVLASGEAYPDALAASSLAGALSAPLLLTASRAAPPSVAAEISRLGATEVVVAGGERAVSEAVVAGLRASGLSVRRIAGDDRYATAALIAAETVASAGGAPGDVLVLSGEGYADAVSAAPLAYAGTIPVLLTTAGGLPPATAAALESLDASRAIIVGGTRAVSPEVEVAVGARADDVIRIAGHDRYATSAALAAWAFDSGLADESLITVCAGTAFPDALAASAVAGSARGVTVLTDGRALTPALVPFLQTHHAPIRILGGESVVTGLVQSQMEWALPWSRMPADTGAADSSGEAR
ncbi:MAG: cell wall-binding repeat-containing protein [Coriobacteriia bacterium]